MHATAQLCKHDIYITMFVNILYKIVSKSVYNFIDAGIKKIVDQYRIKLINIKLYSWFNFTSYGVFSELFLQKTVI